MTKVCELMAIACSPWTSKSIEEHFKSNPAMSSTYRLNSMNTYIRDLTTHRCIVIFLAFVPVLSGLAPVDPYVLAGMNIVSACAFLYSSRIVYDRTIRINERVSDLKIGCCKVTAPMSKADAHTRDLTEIKPASFEPIDFFDEEESDDKRPLNREEMALLAQIATGVDKSQEPNAVIEVAESMPESAIEGSSSKTCIVQ
jgi:hypothetical protein